MDGRPAAGSGGLWRHGLKIVGIWLNLVYLRDPERPLEAWKYHGFGWFEVLVGVIVVPKSRMPDVRAESAKMLRSG